MRRFGQKSSHSSNHSSRVRPGTHTPTGDHSPTRRKAASTKQRGGRLGSKEQDVDTPSAPLTLLQYSLSMIEAEGDTSSFAKLAETTAKTALAQNNHDLLKETLAILKQGNLLFPQDPAILSSIGQCYLHLFTLTGHYSYAIESEKRLSHAAPLLTECDTMDAALTLWNFGKAVTCIAQKTMEIFEIKRAIRIFEQASSANTLFPASYWIDYGSAYIVSYTLSKNINDLHKGIALFKKGISQETHRHEYWFMLAKGYFELFVSTCDEFYFTQLNEALDSATTLQSSIPQYWILWSKALLLLGKTTSKHPPILSAVEKAVRAHELASDNSPEKTLSLCAWAEALAFHSIFTERHELLIEATIKIDDLEEEEPSNLDVILASGGILFATAIYYQDVDYFYQSLEKYQEGVSLDNSHAGLWHAMGLAATRAGEMDDDLVMFERAAKFFQKSIALTNYSSYILDYATTLGSGSRYEEHETWLELSKQNFELGFSIQKTARYLPAFWLIEYARVIVDLADEKESETLYKEALEIFAKVLLIDPTACGIHIHYASALLSYGEMIEDRSYVAAALHHYRLAHKNDEDDDELLLGWAVAHVHFALSTESVEEKASLLNQSCQILMMAAKLGNAQSYYQLACVHALLEEGEKAVHFMKKAEEFNALPPIAELYDDEWLDPIRELESFKLLLSSIENQSIT